MPSGLSESMGASFGPLGAYALAAIIVLVLIIVVMFIAKRALGGRATLPGVRKGPRLAVVDVTALDQRRKLVLVRRDEVEHLVLVGGENDLVVEAGILRTPAALRNGQGVAFDEPEARAVQPHPYPSVIAPEPRARTAEGDAPRQPSPLRRTVPRSAPQASVEATNKRRAEQAAPVPAVRDAQPEPMEEPMIASLPESAPQSIRSDPPPVPPPARQPERPRPKPQAVRRPVAVDPPPVPRATESEQTAQFPVAAEPRVPEFLRRTDVSAAREDAPAPPPVERREPMAPLPMAPSQGPSRIAATDRNGSPAETTRLEAFDAPVVGPSEPVQRPIAGPQSQNVRPEPTAGPPAVPEPREPAERQPLSVRSFASVIQARRPAEPGRPQGTIPQPPEARATPVVHAGDGFSQDARSPKSPPLEPSQRKDPELDDALAQGLDEDFGSLDWDRRETGTAPAVHPETEPVRSGSPAAAPAEQAGNERRPTLEEEMERLLGDFDFEASKRSR